MNKLGLPENAEALGGIPRWLIKLGLPEGAGALGGIPRGSEKRWEVFMCPVFCLDLMEK
jgi:hypothetical protein